MRAAAASDSLEGPATHGRESATIREKKMKVNVGELMVREVVVAGPEDAIGEIRDRMLRLEIHAIPIVDDRRHPVGIVTSSDLVETFAATMPVSRIMTTNIQTVSADTPAHIAARIMRNHRLHHLLVTEGDHLAGILSSFDLLKLVEDRKLAADD